MNGHIKFGLRVLFVVSFNNFQSIKKNKVMCNKSLKLFWNG